MNITGYQTKKKMTQRLTVISRKITLFVNLYSEMFKQSYFNIYNCDLDFVDSSCTLVLFFSPSAHTRTRTRDAAQTQDKALLRNASIFRPQDNET